MKNIFLWRNRSLIKNHSLLGNPLILPQIQILISFWSQKAENQKFEIEEKVMSERVKMPNRHFLRSDYLHFFFYLKFLLFVSLVPKISIWLKYHLYQEHIEDCSSGNAEQCMLLPFMQDENKYQCDEFRYTVICSTNRIF